MAAMFSESLHEYFEQARRDVRKFIAALPCDSIATMSERDIASVATDPRCLPVPSIDPVPKEKNLERDDTIACYTHVVSNSSTLRYKASRSAFGGWPREITYNDDYLQIRFSARDTNPPLKDKHRGIIEQISGNIATLATEVESGNATLVALIAPELEKRKKHCAEIERRRSQL